MTTRERNLWIIVVAVVIGGIGYSIFFGILAPPTTSDTTTKSLIDYDSATRLLSSAQNIITKNDTVNRRLDTLVKMFYPKTKLDEAQIALLKETEEIATQANLTVDQKNMVRYSETLIGVAIEGKTKPESLFKFMQKTTESRLGLKINRVQVHALPEQKMLSFQIVVCSLLL